MDSNFKKVSYRGLDYYPEYFSSSTLNCNGHQYKYRDDGEWQDIDCRNSKGEDHRKSSDYTHGLKITYYFRWSLTLVKQFSPFTHVPTGTLLSTT